MKKRRLRQLNLDAEIMPCIWRTCIFSTWDCFSLMSILYQEDPARNINLDANSEQIVPFCGQKNKPTTDGYEDDVFDMYM